MIITKSAAAALRNFKHVAVRYQLSGRQTVANYLDARRSKPHMKLTAIDKAFGVGESTGQGKSMLIRKTLKIRPIDPAWSLRSRIEENPMAWMIQVNGFLVEKVGKGG